MLPQRRGQPAVGTLSVPFVFLAVLLVSVSAVRASAQNIPLPVIPEGTFNITDFGAVGDGTTMNTEAIQKTIDAASADGGGTVLVPAGKFLTGPIELASSIDFHLARDATLLIRDDIADYPLLRGKDSPILRKDAPLPLDMYRDAITAYDAHDIRISGEGTIDGQGAVWWKMWNDEQEARRAARRRAEEAQEEVEEVARAPHRPNLFRLRRVTRLQVSGLNLRNSPMFHLITEDCTDVVIEGITITAPLDSPNTDGIDFSGWNYLITGCTVDTGDDHIVAKPVSTRQPGNKNITIHNCTLLHGRGVAIGSTTTGGTEDMIVSYCTFDGASYGIHIKSGRDRGGLVQRVRYENITMNNVRLPIFIQSYYASERRPRDLMAAGPRSITTTTPIYRDITIRNVTAANCPTAGMIVCLPEMPIVNLTLDNVRISAESGMRIFCVRGMKCDNTTITAEEGNPVEAFDAEISGLEYAPATSGEFRTRRPQPAPAQNTENQQPGQNTENPTPGRSSETPAPAGNPEDPAPSN